MEILSIPVVSSSRLHTPPDCCVILWDVLPLLPPGDDPSASYEDFTPLAAVLGHSGWLPSLASGVQMHGLGLRLLIK